LKGNQCHKNISDMAILGIHIILVILGIFQSTAIVAMKN
jgi:hypothetical protein